MKKTIFFIFLLPILFFPNKIFTQINSGILISPIQLQFHITDSNESLPVFLNNIGWGFSIHPEVIFQKQFYRKLDIWYGVGYLLSTERINFSKSVNSVFTLLELDLSEVPSTEQNLEIKRVQNGDIYLTVPLGFALSFLENDHSSYFIFAKSEIGILNLSKKKAVLQSCSSSGFGFFDDSVCTIRNETIAEEITEQKFKKFDAKILWNTQFGFGYKISKNKKNDLILRFAFDIFHREHRPGLLKKRRAIGGVFSINHKF
ncbi:MAG: hypothetical protein AB8H03_17190 [Saprospiraceae bacterium]